MTNPDTNAMADHGASLQARRSKATTLAAAEKANAAARQEGRPGSPGVLGNSASLRRQSISAGRLDPVISIDLRVVDDARHPIRPAHLDRLDASR